jgi:hypothetical protein
MAWGQVAELESLVDTAGQRAAPVGGEGDRSDPAGSSLPNGALEPRRVVLRHRDG